MGAPHLITRYARAMLHSAEAHGHDLAEICRIANISPEAAAPHLPVLSPATFKSLIRAVKMALNDDLCGFTRSPCRPGTFQFVCESMVREETLGQALQRAFQFYLFATRDLTLTLEEDGDVCALTLTLAEPALDRFHYLHEWWLMMWPHISSWLIGEEIPVLRVDLPYAPDADPEEYAQAFWGPCRFRQPHAQVRFSARFLRRRIIREVEDVAALCASAALDLVSVSGVHRSWKALLTAKMKECLTKTERLLSIDELAREFDTSSKTLRRRLEVEGISFRLLKEEIRREMVLKLLSQRDIPIGEVSLRAGFAERNGLARAVRSWVGVSPREYRGLVMRGHSNGLPGHEAKEASAELRH